jgi:hypothetical protein
MAGQQLSFTPLLAAPAAVLRLASPAASSQSRNNSGAIRPAQELWRICGAEGGLLLSLAERFRSDGCSKIDLLTPTSGRSIYTLRA